ncbi:peptidoglycan DD-metalloendopeptidase family protein [Paeniglutamicibacter terrestris]|uniref:Peptidoglycan DD-metalloendopeptidase family protein n=1 Tax=Paeniglutamicibacter terrestris TaxID=2723403 RepID=A0ABX1G529_9MICC|nr:peptidoglycan DD-metalloendopeptidase family protein [Paeniglutamicibacter terrestris]NKG21113.1 peptidoglycan DD-metalloendopeptidase family protein [Paeniglutamicibacter terrestris]
MAEESVELGKAYLSLLASTRDMKASVKDAMRELGQQTDGAVKKSGSKLLSGIGGAIGKVTKAGILGIGGLAATVGGLAAAGGISRALAIEDARAKLDGLGHDTKTVDKIMADALASVKGTAFGLGDAASAAASAVASGVKPGKDLQRTLKLTGDAATIAGVGFGDMSAIMNKAAASNKVQGDILAQLGDMGIPIVQLLGESMGKTASEIYDASKDGTISFANLQDAIESGMGGAALKSGKTFRGAWANVMAALGRGGETVIKPVLDLLRDGFNKAIPIIDNVTNAMKPLVAAFSAKLPGVLKEITGGFEAFRQAFKYADGDITSSGFPGFMERLGYAAAVAWDILKNKVIPMLKELVGWVIQNRDWIVALGIAVGTGTVLWKLYNIATTGYKKIAAIVTKLIQGQTAAQLALNAAFKAHPIMMIIGVIISLIAALVYLYNTNETARKIIDGAWIGIKNAVKFAWERVIKPVFDAVSGFVKNVLGPIFKWLYEKIIKPVWEAVYSAVRWAWQKVIQPVFKAIVGFIKNTLGPIFSWLYDKIIKPVWDLIAFAIDAAWNIMVLIFDLIAWTVKNVVGPIFKWLYDKIIKPYFASIVKQIKDSWALMKAVFYVIRDFVRDVLGPIFKWLYNKIVKPVWDALSKVIKDTWNDKIKPIFRALGNFIKDVVGPAFKKGVDIIAGFWDKLKKIALAPINFIIETVYNKGIVGTFNKVAEAIGSKARLKTLGKLGVGGGGGSSNSAQKFGGGGTKFNARAKGGHTPRGWTLVGEEGPELVNFASPGMVYTAAQTKLMQAGQQQAPTGAVRQFDKNGKGMLPQGGWLGSLGGKLGGALAGAWKKSTEWIRGGLAKAAEVVLSPVRSLLNKSLPDSGMARLGKDLGMNAIDRVIKWIKGNDTAPDTGGGGGGTGAVFSGPKGAFHRPSQGPYTSMFGPRWGAFHAGVDIAGGGPTFAALNGLVKYIGTGGGLPGRTGYGIRLDHGGGFQTYYGHNPYDGVKVKVGDHVRAGQRIGTQGHTGNVTGTHLHFETLQNGRALNPMTYLHDKGGWHAPGTLSMNQLKVPEAILTPSEWDAAEKAIELAAKGGKSIDMSGSQFGYDPDEVIRRMEQAERRAQVIAGLNN